jgi:hypothetical protein
MIRPLSPPIKVDMKMGLNSRLNQAKSFNLGHLSPPGVGFSTQAG